MTIRAVLAMVLLGSCVALSPALAAESSAVDGEVAKVDPSAGKITIRHGPLTQFGMDEGMTMVFRAQDPSMLDDVEAGDRITFAVDRINGQFTVTHIEKQK